MAFKDLRKQLGKAAGLVGIMAAMNGAAKADVIVPVVVHANGMNNSVYRSDLKMYNPNDYPITGYMEFTPRGQVPTADDPNYNFVIPAKQTVLFSDVYSLGYPGQDGAARLTVSTALNPATGHFYPEPLVESTTASVQPDGSELTLAVIPFKDADYASTGSVLAMMLGKDGQRTNGFVITGNANTTIQFTYRDPTGGNQYQVTKTYAPLTTTQFTMNDLIGPTAPNGSLEAKIVSGFAVVAETPVRNDNNQGAWVVAKKIN